MESLTPILVHLVLLAGALALFLLWLGNRSVCRRALSELDRAGVVYHVEVGGAAVGRWHVTEPFARLVATQQEIRLVVLWSTYTFRRPEVERLAKHRFLLSSNSLRIDTAQKDVDYPILFWSRDLSRLVLALNRLDWEIEA